MLKGRGGQLLTENIGWSTLYLPELSHPKMCSGAVYTHFTELRTEFLLRENCVHYVKVLVIQSQERFLL